MSEATTRHTAGGQARPAGDQARVFSVFPEMASFVGALKRLRAEGLRDFAVYSPVALPELEHLLPRRGSPVRFVVLVAAIAGCIGGFWMCIGSALLYGLIVGGKQPAAILPYCVIGFELTVLLGGLTAIVAIIAFARLRPGRPTAAYDPRFGEDQFGIAVTCGPSESARVAALLRDAGAREVNELSASDN